MLSFIKDCISQWFDILNIDFSRWQWLYPGCCPKSRGKRERIKRSRQLIRNHMVRVPGGWLKIWMRLSQNGVLMRIDPHDEMSAGSVEVCFHYHSLQFVVELKDAGRIRMLCMRRLASNYVKIVCLPDWQRLQVLTPCLRHSSRRYYPHLPMYPSHRIRLLDVRADDENLEEIGGRCVLTGNGEYDYLHREFETSTRHEEECLSKRIVKFL